MLLNGPLKPTINPLFSTPLSSVISLSSTPTSRRSTLSLPHPNLFLNRYVAELRPLTRKKSGLTSVQASTHRSWTSLIFPLFFSFFFSSSLFEHLEQEKCPLYLP
ncbi:hypothetical protein CDAR_189591 [Caerostris darwini]|uniref:Uncharacterized protein n=1 Tax=Caerostris darwini TaxID=1538125 RepID=A0AAV4QW25_9ARAC|nr:hypothetical protein CDAR_189591 [Caerostris darwini]